MTNHVETAEAQRPPDCRPPRSNTGFTVVELLVVAAVLAFLCLVMASGLSRVRPNTNAAVCQRNLRTLTSAWTMYAEENGDILPAPGLANPGRPPWIASNLEDVLATITSGALFPYVKNRAVYQCPANPAKMLYHGVTQPIPRSYSMSDVFGMGFWLSAPTWRTYARKGEIVLPARTFLFIDEHPDSINDGEFANVCTGAQPGDPPGSARIIDFPANYHDGGCGLSYADGHGELHVWVGARIKNAPLISSSPIQLNVPAQSSWMDMQWLAARTTVRQ